MQKCRRLQRSSAGKLKSFASFPSMLVSALTYSFVTCRSQGAEVAKSVLCLAVAAHDARRIDQNSVACRELRRLHDLFAIFTPRKNTSRTSLRPFFAVSSEIFAGFMSGSSGGAGALLTCAGGSAGEGWGKDAVCCLETAATTFVTTGLEELQLVGIEIGSSGPPPEQALVILTSGTGNLVWLTIFLHSSLTVTSVWIVIFA